MRRANIRITGPRRLAGAVSVSGSKNAALPELAAAVLSDQTVRFNGLPDVEDIKVMSRALQNIGARLSMEDHGLDVHIPRITSPLVAKDIVETSRASILLLGPLVARNGFARVSLPGGCRIGDRQVNYHLQGLRAMGVDIQIEQDHIVARADRLKGIDFFFPAKTVTGTENLLMAAVLAEGTTVLRNCALEPEIGDLLDLLVKMGASIEGRDTETLTIHGTTGLAGARHQIIPDRIEMGTYVIAGCFGENEITITNAVSGYLASLLDILRAMGATITESGGSIFVQGSMSLKPVDIETMPFPGFPTDLQAQLTTLLTQSSGTSTIRETIFNNRFQHIRELNKMGAHIEVTGDRAIIHGKTPLKGTTITATDLRASAALVLGGIIAEGQTVIMNSSQLFRGYENMPGKVNQLGGNLQLIKE